MAGRMTWHMPHGELVISRRERLADWIGKNTVAKTGAGDESHMVFPDDCLSWPNTAGEASSRQSNFGSEVAVPF